MCSRPRSYSRVFSNVYQIVYVSGPALGFVYDATYRVQLHYVVFMIFRCITQQRYSACWVLHSCDLLLFGAYSVHDFEKNKVL